MGLIRKPKGSTFLTFIAPPIDSEPLPPVGPKRKKPVEFLETGNYRSAGAMFEEFEIEGDE